MPNICLIVGSMQYHLVWSWLLHNNQLYHNDRQLYWLYCSRPKIQFDHEIKHLFVICILDFQCIY